MIEEVSCYRVYNMVIKTLYRRQRFPGRGRTVHFRIRSRAVTKGTWSERKLHTSLAESQQNAKLPRGTCTLNGDRIVKIYGKHLEQWA